MVQVEDNGVGFDMPSFSYHPGIGLANTRARLETLYGGRAALEVGRARQGCTIATIFVPYRVLAASGRGAESPSRRPRSDAHAGI
jgi:sensor histidine kinase YesM